MIVVDTSGLLAVLLGEPERDQFRTFLDKHTDLMMSAGTLVEARMVVYGRAGAAMVAVLDALIEDAEIAAIAHQGFVVFGKGRGHAAQLNFGDLFAYASAKAHDAPLLYKGADFAHTDIRSAISA